MSNAPNDRFAGATSTGVVRVTVQPQTKEPKVQIRLSGAHQAPEPDDDDDVYSLLLELRAAVGATESDWVGKGPHAESVPRARENLARVQAAVQASQAELDRVEARNGRT